MAGMTAYEIYQSLHNGRGPGSLQNANDAASVEAQREADRAKRIKELAGKIEAGWQGEAGAAAFGAARPIAVVSAVGASNLELTHNLLNQQTYSFGAARSNVKPVAENPPETGFWDDVSPWDTDTEDEQAQHAADSDHNIRVYRQYDEQSLNNETSLPMDYSTLQDPGGDIGVQRPSDPPNPPGEGEGGGEDKVTPPGTGDRRDPTPPPTIAGDHDETRPQGTDITRPQVSIPPPTPPRPPVLPPLPPPVTPPVNPPIPPMTPPYGPGRGLGDGTGRGTGRGPGGPGTGTGRGPGGGPGGGPGRGPGGSGFGGRPGAGFGPGGGMGSSPNESGARAGAGAHGGDPHGTRGGGPGGAGQGAGGRGGAGGGGGMGAGGGARGQGGEDEEHTRASFLQEDDPEAIFGTDQMTAPPVIGE